MPTTLKIPSPKLLQLLSKVSSVQELLERQGATDIVTNGNDILSTTTCKTDQVRRLANGRLPNEKHFCAFTSMLLTTMWCPVG